MILPLFFLNIYEIMEIESLLFCFFETSKTEGVFEKEKLTKESICKLKKREFLKTDELFNLLECSTLVLEGLEQYCNCEEADLLITKRAI